MLFFLENLTYSRLKTTRMKQSEKGTCLAELFTANRRTHLVMREQALLGHKRS